MIHGVGIDLVEIARIARALKLDTSVQSRFAQRVLSAAELLEFERRLQSAASGNVAGEVGQRSAIAYVAKRFAAKEAFFKALGLPPSEANTWQQLTIASSENGRPVCVFGPLLAALLRDNGIGAAHVSLSDEREHAIATISLEKL